MQNHLLSRQQFAERVGVKPETVKRWERQGKLQAAGWINGRPRYTEAQVNELLEQKPNNDGDRK